MTWKKVLKINDDYKFLFYDVPEEERDYTSEEKEIIKLKEKYPEQMKLVEKMDYERYFKYPEEENIKVNINPENREIKEYNIMHIHIGKFKNKEEYNNPNARPIESFSMILKAAYRELNWEVFSFGSNNEFNLDFKGMDDKGVYDAMLEELNESD